MTFCGIPAAYMARVGHADIDMGSERTFFLWVRNPHGVRIVVSEWTT